MKFTPILMEKFEAGEEVILHTSYFKLARRGPKWS